jgi:hypothetical protein
MIEVLADEQGQLVYARFGDRGPIWVLGIDGNVATQFCDPGAGYMIQQDEAISAVLDMISDVKMPRKLRQALALALALGVDPDNVGTASR